jgi:hypothetical protein
VFHRNSNFLPISPHGITTQKSNINTDHFWSKGCNRNLTTVNFIVIIQTLILHGNSSSKCKAVPLYAMEALGERGCISSYSFSTSALDEGEWSASRPGRAFTLGERTPGTHCTGGRVGPRAGLDTEVRGNILCSCRGSNPDRPVVQPIDRHYTS